MEENEERRRLFSESKMKEQLLTVKALGSTNLLIDFSFLISQSDSVPGSVPPLSSLSLTGALSVLPCQKPFFGSQFCCNCKSVELQNSFSRKFQRVIFIRTTIPLEVPSLCFSTVGGMTAFTTSLKRGHVIRLQSF